MFRSRQKLFLILSLFALIFIYFSFDLVISIQDESSIRIPMISTNASLKRLYESQTVWVRYLADEIPPEKKVWVADNEGEMSRHYDIHDIMMDVNEKKMQKLQLTPPIVVAWVYYLARSISEVFEKHGIHYSIEGGTAIGALRHHGLIPWDDDLDIAVLEEDEAKLLGPVSADLRQNFNISWSRSTHVEYKFFGTSDTNSVKLDYMKDLPLRYPFADVYIYVYNQSRNEFRYRNKIQNTEIKAGLKSMDLSGGTKLVPFGDFKTRISVDMVRYLRESGYSNWKYIGATQWFNHVERQKQTEYRFQLTPQLYAPAYPFRLEAIASDEDANY